MGVDFRRGHIRMAQHGLNRAQVWRDFRTRFCPCIAGIQLLNDGGYLDLRVGGLGVRGMVTLAPIQRGRFDLLTAAGAGVDFVSSRVPSEVTTWTPIGMAGVEAGPAIRFGPGFDAAFVLGLWFDLVDTRFVSSVDERVIFDPFRVRFGAHLRLTWGSAPTDR